MANSVDPDQTAPSRVIWFGSALFADAIQSDKNSCSFQNLQYMIEVAKALSYNQNFIISPCPCSVYMYKIMILLNNFSSETTCPISTDFMQTLLLKQDWEFFPLSVMPIYGKKKIKHIHLLQNQELLKWCFFH